MTQVEQEQSTQKNAPRGLSKEYKSKRYEPATINLENKNSSQSLIIEMAGRNNHILEIGTSTGYITRILKERGNKVIGVEIDNDAAEIARQHCEFMIIGDADELDLDDYLKTSSIDVVLLGDVLEHLRWPGRILNNIKKYLSANGYLVVSLPNICHGDVLLNLLNGDFRYTSMGLLDETHIRFFSRKNILSIFEKYGYAICDLRLVRIPLGFTELGMDQDKVPPELLKLIQALPDSDVYQFVFKAIPSDLPSEKALPDVDFHKAFRNSIEDILRDKESDIASISGKLQLANERIARLEEGLTDRDNLAAQLSEQLRNAEAQTVVLKQNAAEFQMSITDRDNQITSLAEQLRKANSQKEALAQEIADIHRSIVWNATMRFHERFIERVLPQRSRQRRLYDIGLKGGRILVNEGAESFLAKYKNYKKAKRPLQNEYNSWIKENEPGKEDLIKLKKMAYELQYKPKISIITPVWNTDRRLLKAAIDSVLNQVYENWELCIADGGSSEPHVKSILNEYLSRDKRIKVKFLEINKGIAGNSNEALIMANGEYIGLLDHDDALEPVALYEVVKLLNQNQKLDFIYSDEDKIDDKGNRFHPFFKPEWDPDLVLSCGFTNHLSIYRREIVNRIGGFRREFEWSQDYDLLLRFTEAIDERNIGHIPKVLYHWRQIEGSTSADPNAKDGLVIEAAKNALRDALRRRNIKAVVLDGKWPSSYRIKREIIGRPLVSIIIPTKDQIELLKRCISSIKTRSTYNNYEIIVVDNNSEKCETSEYLNNLDALILRYPHEFNFPKINNFAAEHAKGEYLIFLNNDTEVITPDWIQSMLEHSQRPEVGAVGCKLLYPDGSIQHAGVVLGMSPDQAAGVAGHIFNRFSYEDAGYFGMINVIRNYSAVTAAAMMVKRSVFMSVGGFDEDLAICYNDVDLCLRLKDKGYSIIYTPYAELYHHESASRGNSVDLHEAEYMLSKWGSIIKKDPNYSPNLSLESYDCRIDI